MLSKNRHFNHKLSFSTAPPTAGSLLLYKINKSSKNDLKCYSCSSFVSQSIMAAVPTSVLKTEASSVECVKQEAVCTASLYWPCR